MKDYSNLADCGQCSPVILSKDVLNNHIVQSSRDHSHFAPIYRALRDDGVGLALISWWKRFRSRQAWLGASSHSKMALDDN